MGQNVPEYVSRSVPVPLTGRVPWYKSTFPSYFGIFLFVGYYLKLAGPTLSYASVSVCLWGLLVAGLLCFGLYYYVPAMLGMQTGLPLYVVGSSTFGTKGGFLMPGLLMGVLQVGWMSVNAFVSAQFVLSAVGSTAGPGSVSFSVIAGLWALALGYIGVRGIQYVSKFATFLNWIPLLMIIVVFASVARGVSQYTAPNPAPYFGFVTIIQIVVGFFATAGAAGVDFGLNSRNEHDVRWGGLVGVTGAILVAGGLPLMAVAGAKALYNIPDLDFQTVIAHSGGFIATAMFGLFALASIAPACVSSFIAGNSFATMIPGVPRLASTMVGAAIAAILAITGAAADLIGLFTIIGASFGPICGAMMADYLLSGRKWSGPREGVNIAGYGAWAVGFLVGILPFLPIPADVKAYLQPAAVYSFVAGFVVYMALAKAGLQPKVVSERVATAQGAPV